MKWRMKFHMVHVMLIIIFNNLDIIIKINEPKYYYMERLRRDLYYCPQCFDQMEYQECVIFLRQVEEAFHINNLLNVILPNFIPKHRDYKWLRMKDNSTNTLIGKYLNRDTDIDLRKIQMIFKPGKENNTTKQQYTTYTLKSSSFINKWQFCPLKNLQDFVETLQRYNHLLSQKVIWFYLNIDIQLLIMPILIQHNFPVPASYRKCGFTLFQESNGRSLYNFYKVDFKIKVKITKQLIQSAVKFSYGLNNYRIYLTDLTPDNIVYDINRNQLSFIDLNTIYIVDSSTLDSSVSSVHRYEFEYCAGCFSFVPSELCNHTLSDINIFLTCQLLIEDLYGKYENGFLYPIPFIVQKEHPNLIALLKQCVECSSNNGCQNRFIIIKKILHIINDLLE